MTRDALEKLKGVVDNHNAFEVMMALVALYREKAVGVDPQSVPYRDLVDLDHCLRRMVENHPVRASHPDLPK